MKKKTNEKEKEKDTGLSEKETKAIRLASIRLSDAKKQSAETDTGILGNAVKHSERIAASEPEKDPVSASEEILNELNSYKDELIESGAVQEKPRTRGRKKKEPEPEPQPVTVPPKLFVYVCDMVMANGFEFVDGFISKKPIKAKQLQLPPDQQKELEPLALECLKAFKINQDPVSAFFISLFALHFTQFMILKNALRPDTTLNGHEG